MDNNQSKFTKFKTFSLLFMLLFCLTCFTAHMADFISLKLGREIFSSEFSELLVNLSWVSFLGLFAWAFCLAMAKMQEVSVSKQKVEIEEREKFYAKVRKILRDGEKYEEQMKEPRRKLMEEINQLCKEQAYRDEIIRSLEK